MTLEIFDLQVPQSTIRKKVAFGNFCMTNQAIHNLHFRLLQVTVNVLVSENLSHLVLQSPLPDNVPNSYQCNLLKPAAMLLLNQLTTAITKSTDDRKG